MTRTTLFLILPVIFATAAFSQTAADPFTGRWDLTIVTPQGTYPSWMEVVKKDGIPEVHLVGRVASVHPGNDVKLNGAHLSFTSDEHFGKPIKVNWELTSRGGKLSGLQKRSDGVTGKLTAARAPALDRKMPAAWNDPVPLFNGKDLSGWEPLITEQGKPPQNNWKAVNGELVNQAAGANIRTTRTFQDYQLHVEYNCPEKGNSGVYQRGRYEIQVEYEPVEANDKFHGMGSVYGFIAPSQTLPKKPGQWESYDITLVGRRITVVRDGVKTIDNQEIPGITGGALDSHEAQPGPIYIQGDHTGGMKYRNITISTPKGSR
ncbi:MAG: DUF1080 domain-containing protein [Acidobacteriota bacterium]|nr:DUF1080 domain-containing protein [Acidobacteriota bacterium]